MWMLDKPAELLTAWGMNDPLNVPEQKRLLGMPGERTPHEDDREKGMDIIGQLLKAKPLPGQPGPPDPNDPMQQPGPPEPSQSSIQPDWEDDHDFMSRLAKAYLVVNSDIRESNPDGYQNIQLWGQAQESAIPKPPPIEPKTSVALSVKPADVGNAATQDMLQKAAMLDPGTAVEPLPPPIKQGMMPPPGMNGAAPTGPPQ